jgi:type IV pilus assembly protein PilA
MRKWLKHLKNQKGLTLIELLAVVVILGIIAAIAVPAVGNIIDSSKDDAHKSNALLIINAAKLGIVSGEITPPSNGEISLDTLVTEGLLDNVPKDPSIDGKTYDETKSFVTYLSKVYTITLVKTGTPATKYFDNNTEKELNSGKEPNTP